MKLARLKYAFEVLVTTLERHTSDNAETRETLRTVENLTLACEKSLRAETSPDRRFAGKGDEILRAVDYVSAAANLTNRASSELAGCALHEKPLEFLRNAILEALPVLGSQDLPLKWQPADPARLEEGIEDHVMDLLAEGWEFGHVPDSVYRRRNAAIDKARELRRREIVRSASKVA